ncbi:Hypothetical protein SMAX5B_017756 [Scophthalmus maximus]|uniref:Uncharacterized protein n=1 Tax=Scophthalmus maximus TaxID=52904 RepID=A0A2U9CG13_SCOMX|nr:Hypothetical protein SMAX5B_017756 [Scophthalmus maximus]
MGGRETAHRRCCHIRQSQVETWRVTDVVHVPGNDQVFVKRPARASAILEIEPPPLRPFKAVMTGVNRRPAAEVGDGPVESEEAADA